MATIGMGHIMVNCQYTRELLLMKYVILWDICIDISKHYDRLLFYFYPYSDLQFLQHLSCFFFLVSSFLAFFFFFFLVKPHKIVTVMLCFY